jgi:hypothetical protein
MTYSSKVLQCAFVFLAVSFAMVFALWGDPVTAGECHFYIGGCGNRYLDDSYIESSSAANCMAYCGGRTHCQSARTPWGCNYFY